MDSLKFGGIEKNLVTILNHINTKKYRINLIFLNHAIGAMYKQIEIPFNAYFLNEQELPMKKLRLFSNYIKFMPKGLFRKKYHISDADIEIIFSRTASSGVCQ